VSTIPDRECFISCFGKSNWLFDVLSKPQQEYEAPAPDQLFTVDYSTGIYQLLSNQQFHLPDNVPNIQTSSLEMHPANKQITHFLTLSLQMVMRSSAKALYIAVPCKNSSPTKTNFRYAHAQGRNKIGTVTPAEVVIDFKKSATLSI
jgi:hypothetical protein